MFRKTATASGAGTQTAGWNKLFIFRPPTSDGGRWAEYGDNSAAGRLFGRVAPITKADNVYKLVDGTYTTVAQRDYTQIAKIYLGAHNNFVTAEEKADLVAAGYAEYVT